MAGELAAVYISILPETSKIAPGVTKALSGVDRDAGKTGESFGAKLSSGMSKTLKRTAIGVGASAGAALGAGLTKGIGRLNSIEMAQAKLKGLGNSAADVATIMENANAAVKGTAYGLDEAATTAAMAVAAGIKPGKELEQVLTTVADTAGIAGASMGEMGTIFGSVAARGKLQGDDLMQLTSRGIPVLQLLAKELGTTASEVSDMVSKGQIDFKTFERALRAGVGGAALEAGKTTQGALKNMGAAAGRLGATLAGPFYSQAAGAFTGVTSALDAMNAKAKPAMAEFGGWIQSVAVPALKQLGGEWLAAIKAFAGSAAVTSAWGTMKTAVSGVIDALKAVAPAVGNVGSALVQATATLGVSGWDLFAKTLNIAATALNAMSGPLTLVSGVMEKHPGLVAAGVAAWLGFKKVPGVVQSVSTAIDPMQKKATTAFTAIKDGWKSLDWQQARAAESGREIGKIAASYSLMAGSSNKYAAAFGQAATVASMGLEQVSASHRRSVEAARANALSSKDAFTSIDFMAQQMGHSFVASTARMTGAAKGLVAGGFNVMKMGAKSVIDLMGGPWMAAIAAGGYVLSEVVDWSGKMANSQRLAAQSAQVSGQAFSTMFDALSSGKSKVESATSSIDSLKSQLSEMSGQQVSWFQRSATAVDEFLVKIPGLTTELNRVHVAEEARHRDLTDGAMRAKTAIDNLGLSNEQLAQKITGSQSQWDVFISQLRQQSEGGEDAAQRLQQLRDAYTAAQQAADQMTPGAKSAAEALKAIAEKAGTAEDRAIKLRHAFMELNGIQLSAQEASAELTRTIDSMAGQMDQMAGATLNAKGAWDVTTSAGAAANEQFVNIGNAMQKAVAAGEPANEVFARSAGQLRAVADQAGLTEEQYQQLLQLYSLTPEQLTVVADLKSDSFNASMLAIQQQIREVDGQQSTVTMKVQDQEARTKLEDLGFELKVIDEQSGMIELDLEDRDAIGKLNNFLDMELPKLNNAKGTAHADLDVSGLLLNKDLAQAQLQTLDLAHPFPWADLDISRLTSGQLQALQAVGLLDGQHPTPQAGMNIDQLDANQKAALSLIFDLDDERPTPWADLSKDELDAKANDAKAKLEELNRQKTKPYVDAETADALNKIGRVIDMLHSVPTSITTVVKSVFTSSGDGHAKGGVVGRYATGGRLPVTGPGTHTTDGILGVDEYGLPTARVDRGEWVINRKSSARWNNLLAAINRDDPRLEKIMGVLPHLATGGRVSMDDLHAFAAGKKVNGFQASRSLNRAPYEWAGINWGDCAGAISALARFAAGEDPFAARFSTANEGTELRRLGFQPGLGGSNSFSIGWFNGGPWGGHTAGTMGTTRVEMGGGNNGGAIGGGAVGADDPQFTDHAHLELGQWGLELGYGTDSWEYGNRRSTSGSSSGDPSTVPLSDEASHAADSLSSDDSISGQAGSVASAFVKGQVSDILKVFGIPDELPPIMKARNEWVRAKYDENGHEIKNADQKIITAAESLNEAASSVDDSVEGKVKNAVSDRGWDKGAQWDALSEIIRRESSWNPQARNPSSGAFGLFQFLGSTKDTYLPDENPDPGVQAEAGARYIADRYGDPVKALDFHNRNGWYDQGGIATGIGHMLKNTLKPERVLSPEQTKAFDDLVYKHLPALATATTGNPLAGFAADYATHVAGGVAGAMKNYVLDMVETPIKPIAQTLSLRAVDPAVVAPSVGDSSHTTFNIHAVNSDELWARVRLEQAKQGKGMIGAR